VLDARASFIVGDILADRAARSITFGLKNELATTFWAPVKTGTSKDMRDNWCVGYSEKYTVGVWVGNFNGQSMWDVSGVSGAAPVWRDVMDYLHRSTASRAPKPPAGVVRQRLRISQNWNPRASEWFIAGTEPAHRIGARRASLAENPVSGRCQHPRPRSRHSDATQRVFFLAQGGQGLAGTGRRAAGASHH
jgi:penicillin-binding protein 1C